MGKARGRPPVSGDQQIRSLYQKLLAAWNDRSAEGMAALFAPDGSVVGFDGSQINGLGEIARQMAAIFANHPTAAYVSKVEEVRWLSADVVLLRGIAGMVPPGQNDINPAVNAIQSLVAVRSGGEWRIALFQNTPAVFHGRPELVEKMSRELRRLLPRTGA